MGRALARFPKGGGLRRRFLLLLPSFSALAASRSGRIPQPLPKPRRKPGRETRVLELIMLRLRTDRGLRLEAYRKLTGRNFIADNKQLIHGLHRKGMLRIKNGYLSLTASGMLVSNSILEYLFSSTREKLALPSNDYQPVEKQALDESPQPAAQA